MTEAEVEAETRPYRRLTLHALEGPDGKLVAQKGRTRIVADLESGAVQAYQVSWYYGFMKVGHRLKRNLCSGETLVELHLVGAASNAWAGVLLDGVKVAELSGFGTASFDVPLGSHRLEVRAPDGGVWKRQLHYDETSSGWDRVVVEFAPP